MDDPTNYTTTQIASFADALKTARGDRSTAEVVRELPGYTSNKAINNWERGDSPPKPPTIFGLERALGVQPGHLSRHLGFVPLDADALECTVDAAISGDERLTADQREALRNTYRLFITQGSDGR